jgi:autotransporter adhesin
VKYDDAGKGSLTLAGADGTTLHNVAAGTAATDAVNKAQLDAVGDQVDANTLAIGGLDGRVTGIEGQLGDLQQNTARLGAVAVDTVGDGSDDASVAAGSKGVAIGSGAAAGGSYGTAVGGDSYAKGPNDTALGGGARVDADGSTAVGANAAISADATNAVAVGESAAVTAASGTAVGQAASVTAEGAVALGQGSMADRAHTVSVGSTGNERQITNVAAATAGTDAVNKDQLDEVTQAAVKAAKSYADAGDATTLHQANAYADSKLASMVNHSEFDAFRNQVDDRFHAVNTRLDRVGAMGTAMSQMAFSTQGINSANRLGVGVGGYNGQAALSVGYSRAVSERANLTFGAAVSGNEASGGVGFGIGW